MQQLVVIREEGRGCNPGPLLTPKEAPLAESEKWLPILPMPEALQTGPLTSSRTFVALAAVDGAFDLDMLGLPARGGPL